MPPSNNFNYGFSSSVTINPGGYIYTHKKISRLHIKKEITEEKQLEKTDPYGRSAKARVKALK